MPKLSVVIPAYNEERRLPKTLEEIHTYLKAQSYESEILVVVDGAKDNTAEIAQRYQKTMRNLRVIDNKKNHGKGYVVRQGMLEAKGEVRLFTDADNSTSVDHIEKMWPHFDQGEQVVIGTRDSRDHKDAKQAVSQPGWKRLLGDVGNLAIQMLVLPGIWDTQCGFKAFTASAAEDIFARMKQDRWSFDVEALGLARRLGYDIKLVPVYWINDAESHVKFSAYFSFLLAVVKITFDLMRGSYDKKSDR